jgi:DNA helicase-2/ATP-dependent DNA helicase PcrA
MRRRSEFQAHDQQAGKGIGPGVESILSFASQTDGSMFAMLKLAIEGNVLSTKAKAGASYFLRMFEHAQAMLGEGSWSIAQIFDQGGWTGGLLSGAGQPEQHRKVGNLEALVNALSSYDPPWTGCSCF